MEQKSDRKTCCVWDRFFDDFWSILAPNLGGPGGPTNQGFGVKSAPGATLGPKWPPGPIQARFLVDLDRFLVDLGRFWDDFGSILGSMLVDFCLVADG